MRTLVNNYIFKALDAYPYDLEEAMEALNYALSYDEKNVIALTLLGRIYAEALKDFEKSKTCFEEALTEYITAFGVYPHYINVLLWNEDTKEAEKLIDFGLTVKGSNKALLYVKKANLFEQLKRYKAALKQLKKAKKHSYNNEFICIINAEKERIKGKMPKKNQNKNKKKQKKKIKSKKDKK